MNFATLQLLGILSFRKGQGFSFYQSIQQTYFLKTLGVLFFFFYRSCADHGNIYFAGSFPPANPSSRSAELKASVRCM